MNKKLSYLVAVVFCILFLVGCGPRDVRFFPRLRASKEAVIAKAKIEVAVNVMSRKECSDYFGFDAIAEGVRPLVLNINNKSSDAYVLRPSYLALTRVSGKDISKLMHYDTYQRVFWLTWPAIIFWWPAIPCLIIPYGFGCQQYNAKTSKTLRKMTLGAHDVLEVAPYESVQRFIFVPDASFRTAFDIALYNETTRAIELFPINCAQAL